MTRHAQASLRKAASPAPALVERRETCRIHTVCRFARVAGRGDQGLWRVCNISDQGMMLVHHGRVTPGELLAISLSEQVTLEAAVIWSEGGRCGVRFMAPIDCAALLHALAQEQRSPRHRPLRLPMQGWALAFDETGVHSVRIHNLSRQGVGLGHLNRLRRGSAIKLVLESGTECRGVVRWASREQAGVLLLEPLPSAELASAIGSDRAAFKEGD